MKIKVDENLPIDVARILADAGHDALTVHDQSMRGSKDLSLISRCKEEDRALITLDIGFADIRNYDHSQYPGIIVFRLQWQDKDHILSVISRLMGLLETDELHGKLWIVDESRVRIRG